MAWTNPRTWVSNETLTAALLNLHLRDNFRYMDLETIADPTSTLSITTEPNITISDLAVVRAGRMVMLSVSGNYTGSAVTMPTNGNLTNIPVLTIGATGWRPTIFTSVSSAFTGRGFWGGLNVTGALAISAASGSTNIASGEAFQLCTTYIKAAA